MAGWAVPAIGSYAAERLLLFSFALFRTQNGTVRYLASLARGPFLRAHGNEAIIALSAVDAGIIGSLAAVVTSIMMKR